MLPVLNKHDYFKRWTACEFGNRLRAWNTLSELLDSDYHGTVSIRLAESSVYDVQHYVPVSEVTKRIKEKNWPINLCRFNESPDDTKLVIQGEIMDSIQGLYLVYSRQKLPMRKALELDTNISTGLKAKLMLQHFCKPTCYEDLLLLLNLYPDHVIEFSTFSYNLGILPHRSTVIWEVRKY